jgi:penicillin-insensitive murein endopeptidase
LAQVVRRRYSEGVQAPVRTLVSALASALVVLSSPARADDLETTKTNVAHGHRHHRRAKAADAAGRASRGGAAAGHDAKKKPAERAESIGSPNDGFLKGGQHIDLARPYYRVVPVYESGDVRWGHPQLVNMIDRAARNVWKRYPGAVLDVGDLSQRGGGDLLRHHSHESGRDADLGFYVVDAKGKQVHARTFIKFDTNMASPTVAGAKYDLARNWAFVQELLTDPVAHVSHIFIADWIRHELLAYGRVHASRGLWDRAAVALMQPHHSLAHDDHIHVRISCPHEARSSCIELAKTSPSHGAHSRVAHRGQSSGHVLRTPVHAPHAGKPPAASAVAPRDLLVLPDPPSAPDSTPDPDGLDEPIVD